jgi:hypothetical protein
MDLIDSLVSYVNEIKPYHTKIYGVDVEYRAFDTLSVSFTEDLKFGIWLGVPFRDLTNFDWNVNSLTVPASINFTDFMHQHGCDVDLYQMWDDQVDGFDIVEFLTNGVTVTENITQFLQNLTQITLSGTDQNDGTYDIVSFDYDESTQLTTIIVDYDITPEAPSGNVSLSKWDGVKWDSTFNVDEECILKTGLMHEFVAVSFSETFTINIEKITNTYDPDCDVIIGRPWDPDIDGIAVYGYTSTSIILFGNITPILTLLSSFEILGSDVNDGTYTVVDYEYQPSNDTTSITVSMGPNPLGVGGRARVSFWDSNEWDGDSLFNVSSPAADLCAHTCFGETLFITDSDLHAGWDDNSGGGWDSGLWDDVNNYIQQVFSCGMGAAVPPPTPPPTDQTSDQYWKNDPLNSIPYTWNDIQMYWEHATTGTVWEFALIPRIDGIPGDWVTGLRASVLRITMTPGPDDGNFGVLFGNLFLYDTSNAVIGTAPFSFSNYIDPITVDINLINVNNLDYAQLLIEAFIYNTGPRISLIEFDPV